MTDDLYFEPDPYTSTRTLTPFLPAITTIKPTDTFTTPPLLPNTIFYLSTVSPHTDTHTIQGPFTKFAHLLPSIERIASNSPKAIDKFRALRSTCDIWGVAESNHEFTERGFETFVVEGQRGIYSVLKVLREVNEEVAHVLPCPVYVVTRHGPLSQEGRKGYAASTGLVGAFVERGEARKAAGKAMEVLVKGKVRVWRSEVWGKGGKGGGLLMAMTTEERWEIRIGYEDQVHKRVMEGREREGEEVEWRF